VARLGELERVVMGVLWDRCAPATGAEPGTSEPGTSGAGVSVREVAEALRERDLAYTTVMTVLDRLAGKGMVVRHRAGRAWRYQPAAAREAYVAQLMLDALDLASPDQPRADAGGRDAALVRFARSVSGDEAEVLRAALDEVADRRPRRKG
jgi:predicted transcriptional regulator